MFCPSVCLPWGTATGETAIWSGEAWRTFSWHQVGILGLPHRLYQHVSFVCGNLSEDREIAREQKEKTWSRPTWRTGDHGHSRYAMMSKNLHRRLIWIEWWQKDMREDSSHKLQPIEGWVLSSTGIRLSRLTTSDGLAHTGLWDAGVGVVTELSLACRYFQYLSVIWVSNIGNFGWCGDVEMFLGLESFLFAAQPRVKRVQFTQHCKSLPGFALAKMEGCLFFLWQPLFEFYWPDAPNRMEWHGMIGRNWLWLTTVDLVIDST